MNSTLKSLLIALSVVSLAVDSTGQTENTLLWKVEGEDIKTSYVFGTIHLIPAEDFLLKKKVLKALKKSDQLVMEIDLSDPGIGKEMLSGVMMRNDSTLDQLMTPRHYEQLDSMLKAKTGMGVNFYKRWKPLLISAMIDPFAETADTESYEMSLMALAQEQEKPIEGLESVSEQLAIFDSIPYSLQAESLIEMFNAEVPVDNIVDDAVELYKQEAMTDLYNISVSYFESELTREFLLDQRNINWISQISEMASEDKCFFAVGAAHLGGELGILKLLRKAGYEVTPVFK
jgi:uncharacterized protein YbaP (TraB family)